MPGGGEDGRYMREKWILENKKADFRGLAQAAGVSPLLAKLAVNRGYETEEKIREYFFGTLRSLHDPRLLKDAEAAAALIRKTLAEGGRVGIASDFDVDGIFSALILWKAIRRLG